MLIIHFHGFHKEAPKAYMRELKKRLPDTMKDATWEALGLPSSAPPYISIQGSDDKVAIVKAEIERSHLVEVRIEQT